MAIKKVKRSVNPIDLLEQINDGLKLQVREPNIYAYHPHDKQFQFHSCTKPIILYIGGNRSGKTVGGAAESVFRLDGRHPYKSVPPPPVRGRAVAVDWKYGVDQIIIPKIKQYLPPSLLINGSWEDSFDSVHMTLNLTNKSSLELKSYEQDVEKFAGTSRHFCWYDEEPPKPIFNESQARLIDTDGDAFITMTPVEGMTWVFYDIYQPAIKGERDDVFILEIDMAENPYIPRASRERYLNALPEAERNARGRGKFTPTGGLVFKGFSAETHVIPFQIPPKEWEWYVSIDHGFNNPTAILWHAVSPQNEIITFYEHYESEMLVSEHAAVIKQKEIDFGKAPSLIVGDPAMAQRNGTTGTSILQEYQNHGIFVVPASNAVEAGIEKMNAYFRVGNNGYPRWRITENCSNFVSECEMLRWQTYTSLKIRDDKNKQEKIHKKDDHTCDSARYFVTFMPDLTPIALPEATITPENVLGASKSYHPSVAVASSNGGWGAYEDENKQSWNVQFASALYENE